VHSWLPLPFKLPKHRRYAQNNIPFREEELLIITNDLIAASVVNEYKPDLQTFPETQLISPHAHEERGWRSA